MLSRNVNCKRILIPFRRKLWGFFPVTGPLFRTRPARLGQGSATSGKEFKAIIVEDVEERGSVL